MRYKKDYSLYKRPTKKGINVYYYRTYENLETERSYVVKTISYIALSI